MTIAQSGMLASTARLAASASNVANVRTRGPIPPTSASEPVRPAASGTGQVYQAVEVVQRSVGTGGAGVAVAYRPTIPSHVREYDPSSPDADSRGMVAAPNVDDVREAASRIEAELAFRANLSVFEAADAMTRRLLDLSA